MSAQIHFPQGPINDPQTNQLSLEWFMFLQQLQNGLVSAMQMTQAQSGFATTMLNMAEDDSGTDAMMALIPGQVGPQGLQGMFIPGMDGADGEDAMGMQPPGNNGNPAQFTELSTRTIQTQGYTVATLPAGKAGMRAYVTDALAPTFLGILVGGGAVVTPCFYNGTNWISE